jgi:subtilase family serine protease
MFHKWGVVGLRRCAPVLFGLLFLAIASRGQTSRLVAPIDPSHRSLLQGYIPPRAQPQYDQGPVEPSFPLEYVTLLLKPSAQQQQALEHLLAEQQDSSSQNYRRWLTPEEYADRFGFSRQDLDRIEAWLHAEGFRIADEARARNWIAFSGAAEQVGRAFRTEIHRYVEEGEAHYANATDPSIPATLAGMIAGLRGLDDFRPQSPNRVPNSIAPGRLRPRYTNLLGTHYLAPDDIATIYDLNPIYAAGIDGTGQKIAVVGQTDINLSDIANFRSIFNLPSNPPQLRLYGSDPGVRSADVDEAEMDLEWAGAVARNAAVIYVYSTDVLTSVTHAVDDDVAPVISYSYVNCEANESSATLAAWRQITQLANGLGITWVAAAGDAGAAGCDWKPSAPVSSATHGKAVSFPASIPEVTAVGGTEFNEGSGSYWNFFNGSSQGSAVGYIPEKAWNDTSFGTLAGTGGGQSDQYPTPWWQMGPGFPNDGWRDVPDVSLAASADHDGYITCVPNMNCPGLTWKLLGAEAGFHVQGGTSAATPVFAGILALLNHYLVSQGGQAGLGNANPTLYWLAQNSPSAFHDITTGNNIVPCVIGTPDCTTGYLGFSAGPGYDQATGLGSVDAARLLVAWAPLPVPKITSISPITPKASSQNQTVTVNGIGFQNGLRVVVISPTGDVSTLQGSGQIQAITSSSFQMIITLNGAGLWSIQVINADGRPSDAFGLTAKQPVAPLVTTSAPSAVGGTSATLGGLVNPNGSDTQAWFQYSTNSSMSGSVATAQQDIGSGTSTVPFSASITGLSGNRTYYFQAWASNAAASASSTIWSFTTQASAPPAPALISPSNGATGVPLTMMLTWNASTDATSYDVYFGTAASPPLVASTAQTSYSPATLSAGALYFWRVVAKSSLGSGASSVWSFTTPTASQPKTALRFVPVTPCRIVDTRGAAGPFNGPTMAGNSVRAFAVPQSGCGIPNTAQAYSLNVTVLPEGHLSYLSLWPTGQSQPLVSTLNSFAGDVVANAAIVPAGSGGAVSVYVTDPTDVILDINGYFDASASSGAFSFYPATPCRVADTRGGAGTFGGPSMQGGMARDFPVPLSPCGIPATAGGYSLNVTVVPPGYLGYLSTWPTGQAQPNVSTLNSWKGKVVANAAIVPTGTNESISVFVSNPTDVILDINGYFGQAGRAGALSFYPVAPCRVADTRGANGPFGGPEMGVGSTSTRSFAIPASGCNIPSTAAAYSLNVTVVPGGPLSYLSTWPTGSAQPLVSTLNSFDGSVVANAAIVPAGTSGAISVYVTNPTHVILDINGYFAP